MRWRGGLVALLAAAAVVTGFAVGRAADPGPAAEAPEASDHTTGVPLNVNPIPDPERTGWHGGILDEPLPRPAFTLTDTSGTPYDFAEQTAGKTTLLLFGYTHCPDVCPMHLANIAGAMREQGLDRGDVDVVFVTADPERDTPERLGDYLDHFNPGFVGLTGEPAEITRVLGDLGLPPPTIARNEGSDNYLVGHPAQIIAFTPDDLAHLVYPFGGDSSALAHDLPRLVEEGFSR
jgi:protein SCO1